MIIEFVHITFPYMKSAYDVKTYMNPIRTISERERDHKYVYFCMCNTFWTYMSCYIHSKSCQYTSILYNLKDITNI